MIPSSTGTADPGRGWTVTAQTETTELGPSGRYEDGLLVSFTTQHGVETSVFVPRRLYSPERVRAMVADKAAAVDAVSRLSDTGA